MLNLAKRSLDDGILHIVDRALNIDISMKLINEEMFSTT